jgi:NTE family protein/lysophospholipid hydrolase
VIDSLELVPVLGSLNAADLQLLASASEQVDLSAGAVLFEQGAPADAFYIVRSGTLRVVVTLPTGERHPLATIGAGDLVGEMAVLYSRPRSASVHATTSASLLKIHSSTVQQLLAANPSARSQLLAAASRRLPSLYLASVPMFAGLDAAALRELDLESNWIQLAGGQTLFQQGDYPDFLYVVAQGRLEVVFQRDDGGQDVVRHMGRGEVVGEVALLSGEPRNATVRAIRDSELVRLSKAELYRLLERHPRGAIEMVRLLAGRIRPGASARRSSLVSTIAVVPLDRDGLLPGWTARLVEALSSTGGTSLHVTSRRIDEELGLPSVSSLDDELSGIRVATWLRAQEDRFRYVVSECDPTPSWWTDLCLRQADLVLLVASADGEPTRGELARRLFDAEAVARSTPKELVLLHPATTAQPSGAARWLAAFPVTRHHHVRIDRQEDYARLARFLAGRAFGLVMSGGGARAFAHVGVLRALSKCGVPIDTLGCVSASAFPAAFCALGHDVATVERLCLENMGNYSFLGEATLPMAAFLSGKNLVRFLRRMFGDVEIEDLWLPFYCVSANLTTARVVVLDRGPLWMSVRATTSVPGIHPPVCVNGELLVDGGVLDNLPVDVMRNRCPGTVIATDVSLAVDLTTDARDLSAASGWPLLWARISPFAKAKPELPHIFEILTRAATLSSTQYVASMARAADLYMRTPTDGIPTLDWQAGAVLIERGYRMALQEIEKWKQTGDVVR